MLIFIGYVFFQNIGKYNLNATKSLQRSGFDHDAHSRVDGRLHNDRRFTPRRRGASVVTGHWSLVTCRIGAEKWPNPEPAGINLNQA
jgi:hypothetical protein